MSYCQTAVNMTVWYWQKKKKRQIDKRNKWESKKRPTFVWPHDKDDIAGPGEINVINVTDSIKYSYWKIAIFENYLMPYRKVNLRRIVGQIFKIKTKRLRRYIMDFCRKNKWFINQDTDHINFT